jgi:hypothetical protein
MSAIDKAEEHYQRSLAVQAELSGLVETLQILLNKAASLQLRVGLLVRDLMEKRFRSMRMRLAAPRAEEEEEEEGTTEQ